jgi:predicted DNA-binding transcriptional regulator AlpA
MTDNIESIIRKIVREEVQSALAIRPTPSLHPSRRVDADVLKPQEVADRLGVAVHTLSNWRARDVGPSYIKIGRMVRYREGDLAAWMLANSAGFES